MQHENREKNADVIQQMLLVLMGFMAGAGAGFGVGLSINHQMPRPDQVRTYMKQVVDAETLEYQQHKKALELRRARRRNMRPEHNPNPHARVFKLRRRRRPVLPVPVDQESE